MSAENMMLPATHLRGDLRDKERRMLLEQLPTDLCKATVALDSGEKIVAGYFTCKIMASYAQLLVLQNAFLRSDGLAAKYVSSLYVKTVCARQR